MTTGHLFLESLESRDLLTSDVSIVFANGQLDVQGGNADDAVSISGNRQPGNVTVNGQAFSGVTDLRLSLGGGSDLVHFYETYIPGTVSITLGSGRDTLNIYDLDCGYLAVNAAGQNTINVHRSNVDHDAVFELLGSAPQHMTIDSGPGPTRYTHRETTIGGTLTVNMSSGNDVLELGCVVATEVVLDGGAGRNHFHDLGNNTFGSITKTNFL